MAEYKNLDKNVLRVLLRPLSEEDWDQMLKTVEYYIFKLMNHGLRISQKMETNKIMVNKILGNGRPKFMNFTINEEELVGEVGIPYEKIREFHDMKKELEGTWVEFVKIAKGMKWQKNTRKPYIIQGAFHGRRLGRRKGRKQPYPLKEKSATEISELNESDFYGTSEESE